MHTAVDADVRRGAAFDACRLWVIEADEAPPQASCADEHEDSPEAVSRTVDVAV